MKAANNAVIGIDNIRPVMIQPKLLQLHSGVEGFESPDTFAVYRHTGGKPLGVVGDVYTPPDLNLFLDLIEKSINKCADWLPLDKIEYVEMKGGGKVRISIPGPKIEVKSRMVGDIVGTRLDFIAGLDGLTKTSLAYFVRRLWCANGASRLEEAESLSFKNTPGNQGKWLLFCDQILTVLAQTRDYGNFLNQTIKREVTQKDVDVFFKAVLGFTHTEYKEKSTKMRKIFDRINEAVAIEMNNTGDNVFGLLQGITRYTSHDYAKGNMDLLMFDTPAKLTSKAHKASRQLILS